VPLNALNTCHWCCGLTGPHAKFLLPVSGDKTYSV
jgi:hypothetical protein